MAGKRKRTSSKKAAVSRPTQKKQRLQNRDVRISTSEDREQGGFLDLPSAIRNRIHEIWAGGETIHIPPRGVDDLTATHPNALACKQTRDEFLSIVTQDAAFAAPRVKAQNIYKVKQFMKLVAKDTHANLEAFDDDGGRELHIDVSLSE